MAHFFGIVQGNRGDASRLGSKNSGLSVRACSWEGAVTVYLYEYNGKDFARVCLAQHRGHGIEQELYNGPVAGIPASEWDAR